MRLLTLSCFAGLLALPLAAQEASVEEALDMMTQSYQEAWKGGDAAAAASVYSEDATFVDFTGEVIEGRSAIQENITETLQQFQGSSIEITRTNLHEVAPEIVVADGTWQITGAQAAEGVPTGGQYTVILHKMGADWQIVSQLNKIPQEMPTSN